MKRQIMVAAAAVLVLAVSFCSAQGVAAPTSAPVAPTGAALGAAATQPVLTGAAAELDKVKSMLKLPGDANEAMLLERLSAIQPAVDAMEKAYPDSAELPEAELIGLIAAAQIARSNCDMKMVDRVQELGDKILKNPQAKGEFKMLADAHILLLKRKPPTATAPSATAPATPATPAEIAAFREQVEKFLSKYDKGDTAVSAMTLAMQMYQATEDYEMADKLTERVLTGHPDSRVAQAITAMRSQSFSATLNKLDGAKINLPQDMNGQVFVVYFWATYLPASAEQLPALTAMYKNFHDRGFQIVTISLDKDKAALEDFLKKNDYPFIHTFSGEQMDSTAVNYGVRALPSVILVGKDGNIRSASILSMPELEFMVNKALQAPASAPASKPASKPAGVAGEAK